MRLDYAGKFCYICVVKKYSLDRQLTVMKMQKKGTYMKLMLTLLIGLLSLNVNAQQWQNDWYIMVEKAELFAEPDVNSAIVGYVYKSESPQSLLFNTDGSWAKMNVGNKTGWVMTCVCQSGHNDSYGFDYETCYKLNKQLEKGEITQKEFAQKFNELQGNSSDIDECLEADCVSPDAAENTRLNIFPEKIGIVKLAVVILWIICLVSFILVFALRKAKLSGLMLLLLGLAELMYVLHPDLDTHLSGGRMIEHLVIALSQLIMIVLMRASSRTVFEKGFMLVNGLLLLGIMVIFVGRYGLGAFLLSLLDSIVGIILLVIVGAFVVMAIKAPPTKKSPKAPKKDEDDYGPCRNCRLYVDQESYCAHHRMRKDPGDSCEYYKP